MIGAPKKPTAAAAPGNVTPQKLDTNEQARVIPYFAGRRWFPLTWIVSNVYNITTTPVTSKVGKSTKTTGYIYGGDVAGLVCLGSVDYLEQIEVDGTVVWAAGISRDGGHVDHTGDIVVPGTDTGCGTYRLQWGTETQAQANFIVCGAGAPEVHPDYRGQCFLEIKKLVFGEGRTTPPNIRVLVERSARFGGLDENRSREGANPITSLAEVVGDTFFGLGRPDLVDVTSWNNLCTDIQRSQTQPVPGDPTHTAVMGYCSPYIESAESLQSFAGKILENFDGWIRRKAGAAALEIGRFPHDGVVPGGLLELTLDDLADKPQFDSPGFSDDTVITDAIVKGLDRDWNMDPTSEIGPNAAARQRLGERRVKTFDRPFVHTSYQKKAQANELANFYARPETSVTDSFRREKVVTLLPGDRFIFNWGPSSFRQVMRIINRRDPGTGGTIELSYVVERGLSPLGYVATAQPAPALPDPPAPAAITAARIFQLPIGFLADPAPAVVALASRPSANTLGLDLYFSTDDVTYDAIAQTKRWALHGSLSANIGSGTAAFNVAVAGPELALLATQSPAAQNDDTLLLICGVEIMSIGAVVAGGGGVYTVNVLRGRQGSAAAAHLAGTDDVYIIPRGDLEIVQHESFPRTVTNEYFKLRAFTPQDEQLLAAALRIVFAFAGATTAQPSGCTATGKAEAIFLAWTLPLLADGTPDPTIVTVEIAELAHGAGAPANGRATAHDFEGYANGFNRGGLAAGTQKDYYFRCRDTIDDVSNWVGPVTATANAAPTGPTGATGATGASGTRGSKQFYAATTGTSWSDTEADAAIAAAGLTKVLLDQVTLYKISAGYSETRFWDGGAWLVVTQVIDGNLLVNGTIGAAKISVATLSALSANLGTVTAGTLTSVTITSTSGSIAGLTLDTVKLYNALSSTQKIEFGSNGSAHLLLGDVAGGSGTSLEISAAGGIAIRKNGGAVIGVFDFPTGSYGRIYVANSSGTPTATLDGNSGNASFSGTLTVTGQSTFNDHVNLPNGKNINCGGDIFLGLAGVNRWLYDGDGNRLLQKRYAAASAPADAIDDATCQALTNWLKAVVLHHGLGA